MLAVLAVLAADALASASRPRTYRLRERKKRGPDEELTSATLIPPWGVTTNELSDQDALKAMPPLSWSTAKPTPRQDNTNSAEAWSIGQEHHEYRQNFSAHLMHRDFGWVGKGHLQRGQTGTV